MGAFTDILARMRPKILDATGIEIGPDEIVAVRIRRNDQGLVLAAMATLPPIALPSPD